MSGIPHDHPKEVCVRHSHVKTRQSTGFVTSMLKQMTVEQRVVLSSDLIIDHLEVQIVGVMMCFMCLFVGKDAL